MAAQAKKSDERQSVEKLADGGKAVDAKASGEVKMPGEAKPAPASKGKAEVKSTTGKTAPKKNKAPAKGALAKDAKAGGKTATATLKGKTFSSTKGVNGNRNGLKAPQTDEEKRKRLMLEQKAKINDDLKKVARKIMAGGTAMTFVALAGLYLISQGGDSSKRVWGGVLLILGAIGFGVLGGLVYRMHASGKDAANRRRQRRQSQRARQDIHQFAAKLSAETRQKLLEVDARQKIAGGKTAEAMYIKLKEDELSNALQFLCMTSRNGEFELNFGDKKDGARLFLDEGTVVFAKFADFEGLEAIARLLKAGAADAYFFEGRSAPGRNLEMPISGILLNASVMSDEMK